MPVPRGSGRPSASSRSFSASEVARNVKHFETWSIYQGCDQVAYSDIPDELKSDVAHVFEFYGQLPLSWVDQTSDTCRHLEALSPDWLRFMRTAEEKDPTLFSDAVNSTTSSELFTELNAVFLAWRQLRWMRRTKEKWSEADFVANVYNVFRGPAVRNSAYRTQCSISLPQPLSHLKPATTAIRILHPKVAIPDCTTFIQTSSIRELFHSAKSPYKVIKGHPSTTKRAGTPLEASFRFQSTPCAQLPDLACFEFASSFFEDKKPSQELLEHAYRQNRMATASALRHLYSFRVQAPVFGLVWANGTVRAHVDWCVDDKGFPTVLSAPFPGSPRENGEESTFREWNLEEPDEIIQVYLLIRNIDRWTTGRFRERVVEGVNGLATAVVHTGDHYSPWKRVGDLLPGVLSNVLEEKENVGGFMTPPSQKSDTVRRSRRK